MRRPATPVTRPTPGPSILVLAIVALTASPAVPAHAQEGSDDARARELVDRWIEAVGGMEAYHGFRSARFRLTTELYDPETGRLRRARPRYVTLAKRNGGEHSRIERWTWDGSHFVVQGFDGGEAWAVVDGEPAPPDHKESREAIYVCRDVFYWFSLPFKLTDPGVNLHYEGPDTEDRHVVRVTFGQDVGEHQDTWWYRFQEERAVPVEVAYREEGRENVNRLRWEDLRTVDGYVYPARRVHVNADGRVWKILRYSDVVLNPELDPAIFSRADVSPWVAAGG